LSAIVFSKDANEEKEEERKKIDREYSRSSFVDKDSSILLTHTLVTGKKTDREKNIF
jgi:hypothetical protein